MAKEQLLELKIESIENEYYNYKTTPLFLPENKDKRAEEYRKFREQKIKEIMELSYPENIADKIYDAYSYISSINDEMPVYLIKRNIELVANYLDELNNLFLKEKK